MPPTRTAPSDRALRDGLARALAEVGIAPPQGVARRPSAYATSFPLEELDVTLADGGELRLVCKRLDWGALDESGRLAKPAFLHDPEREPAVYAGLLAPRRLGPRYYGATIDAAADRRLLFLERVEGRELYQVGELELWRAAAAWLAQMHDALAGDLERHLVEARLIEYDAAYYRRWIARAGELMPAAAGGKPKQAIAWLAGRYDRVVESLLGLPRTVLHGEFYASNVIVGGDPAAPRVCPVDWEMAAAGPGLIDLAALVSGGWGEDEREAIVAAYRSATGSNSFSAEQLDLARLHLAVQWLGWAPPGWVPPEGQRHDWLGEALELSERLDL